MLNSFSLGISRWIPPHWQKILVVSGSLLIVGLAAYAGAHGLETVRNMRELAEKRRIVDACEHLVSKVREVTRAGENISEKADSSILASYRTEVGHARRMLRKVDSLDASASGGLSEIKQVSELSTQLLDLVTLKVASPALGAAGLQTEVGLQSAVNALDSAAFAVWQEHNSRADSLTLEAEESLVGSYGAMFFAGVLALGIFLSITYSMGRENERYREKLRRNAQGVAEIERVFDSVSGGLTVSDSSGSFRVFNEGVRLITGYSREDARTLFEFCGLVHRNTTDLQHCLDDLTRLEVSDGIRTREYPVTTKSGEVRNVLVASSIVATGMERLIVRSYSDITELRLGEAAYRDTELRHHLLYDRSPIPVIVYDASTFAILDANQAAMQCYGYSRDNFLEMNVEHLVTPDLSGEWLMYAVTRQADSAQRGVWKHITADGRVLSVDLHSHKMSWAGTEARMMLIVDLTDRIRIEREREELIERLQHALAEVRTLSGLLPICAWCKKVRDDQGYYHQIEHYISQRSDATFSHGICPECLNKFNREVEERRQKSAAADH